MQGHLFDLKAERALIGSIIVNPNTLLDLDQLDSQHFYHPPHQKVFEAIKTLESEHTAIDLITIRSKLTNLGVLEKLGGDRFLAELSNEMFSSAMAQDYMNIVGEKARARKVIEIGNKVIELGVAKSNGEKEIEEKLDGILLSLHSEGNKDNFKNMLDILKNLLTELDDHNRKKGEVLGISTGFKELDHLLLGFRPGQMVVLAARPSVGKSALALCILLNSLKKNPLPMGFISLEMTAEEIMERGVSITGNINLRNIKTKNFTPEDLSSLARSVNHLQTLPLHICDQGGLTLSEIRSRAIKLKMETGLSMLVIDYIGLIKTTGRYGNMVHEIGEISMGIKALAKELKIPIIILSQLNRRIESRDDKEPMLSDLKDSGSIEQDADIVMFIDRNKEHEPHKAKLFIKKNRGGELGNVDLHFVGATTEFRSV